MKSLFSLALLCLLGCYNVSAQGLMGNPDNFMNIGQVNPNTNLYSITEEQYNHHFEYQLPNDGVLKIDFLRLGDWGEKNLLMQVTNTAAIQVTALKDSFKYGNSGKKLEINIPINNEILSVNYNEDNQLKNQLAYKNGSYYQLKTGFDTIRVVKNVSVRKKPLIDSGLVQIQYTYILKDLKDIIALNEDPATIKRIGMLTDSIIQTQGKHIKRKAELDYRLVININTNNNDSISLPKANTSLFGNAFYKYIGLYAAFGGIIYNNSVAVYSEASLAFLIPTRGKLQGFVGFNFSGFGSLATSSKDVDNGGAAIFRSYNAEVGVCKKANAFMPKKTSFFVGVMTVKDQKAIGNFGGVFGINNYFSVGLNFASNFKGGDKGRSISGVHFKFNL